jgi:hypothetical protein
MIKTFLNARVNAKIAAGLIAIAAAAGVGMKVKESHATVSNLTGSCGMIFSKNMSGFDTYNNTQTNTYGGAMMMVNFDTGTITSSSVNISNYGQSTVLASQNAVTTTSFTQAAGPLAGSYVITINSTPVTTVNLLAVNSGNTFLVQFIGNGIVGTAPATGICQKV